MMWGDGQGSAMGYELTIKGCSIASRIDRLWFQNCEGSGFVQARQRSFKEESGKQADWNRILAEGEEHTNTARFSNHRKQADGGVQFHKRTLSDLLDSIGGKGPEPRRLSLRCS